MTSQPSVLNLTSPDPTKRANPYIYTFSKRSAFDYKSVHPYEQFKLNSRTANNLSLLTDSFGVIWKEVYVQEILRHRPHHQKSTAHSYLIVGQVGDRIIQYLRKETMSPAAGQTYLMINGINKIMMTEVLGLCYDEEEIITYAEGIGWMGGPKYGLPQHVRRWSKEWLEFVIKNWKVEVALMLTDKREFVRYLGQLKMKDKKE